MPRRSRPSNRPPDPAGERGAATVLGAFLAALLLTVTIALAAVASAVVARHRAQAGADLAALAAALLLPAGPAPACERAATVLHSMRIQLADCAVERVDVVVTATVPVRLGRWELGTARAAARAGPGP
ncbi:MAG: Rv3654c family TadE-like protein [Mycobacterium sp.]